MLRVLFIEDQEESIEPILHQIRSSNIGIKANTCTFDDAETQIRTLRPDIVVLDLWEGDVTDDENKGSGHLNFIWNQQFCPVIIHSAQPDIPEEHRNAFVCEVTKGQDSPRLVLEAIDDFRPHVEALKGVEEHIRNSFSIAMRDVAPSTFDVFTDIEERNDAILRAGRRRLAALMDEVSLGGQELAGWEQYICPPVSKDILLGDVLRRSEGDWTDPASFRVVLTPSCDLASGGGREARVRHVLVAKCCSTREGLDLTSFKGMSTNKLKGRISSVLSRGYIEAIVPFPALQGRIPTLIVNLRELELIPLCDVGTEDKLFLRIASLDSPFRELVSWAYVQVSGRPGLPGRDFASWRDEIVADYAQSTVSTRRV